jgi:serine/threonine protein kinase
MRATFGTAASDATPKIADVGLPRDTAGSRLLKTTCSSTEYSQPEVLRGLRYDGTKADVLSLGVMLCALCVALPWRSRNATEMCLQAIVGNFLAPLTAPRRQWNSQTDAGWKPGSVAVGETAVRAKAHTWMVIIRPPVASTRQLSSLSFRFAQRATVMP